MEWEICPVVLLYWGYVGTAQNISRQTDVHAHIRSALHLRGREKPLALGKSPNVQKVNLPLCVTPVVSGTAAQKGWLCCWKLPQRVLLTTRKILSTKGLVSKERKKKVKRLERSMFCSIISHNSVARRFSWQAVVKNLKTSGHD